MVVVLVAELFESDKKVRLLREANGQFEKSIVDVLDKLTKSLFESRRSCCRLFILLKTALVGILTMRLLLT